MQPAPHLAPAARPQPPIQSQPSSSSSRGARPLPGLPPLLPAPRGREPARGRGGSGPAPPSLFGGLPHPRGRSWAPRGRCRSPHPTGPRSPASPAQRSPAPGERWGLGAAPGPPLPFPKCPPGCGGDRGGGGTSLPPSFAPLPLRLAAASLGLPGSLPGPPASFPLRARRAPARAAPPGWAPRWHRARSRMRPPGTGRGAGTCQLAAWHRPRGTSARCGAASAAGILPGAAGRELFAPPPTPPRHPRPCGEPPGELVPSWGAKPCWGGRVIWVSACPHSAGERSLPCSRLLPQPRCLSASSPGGVLGGGLSLLALPLAPGWGLLGGRDGAGGCWQCPMGLAPPPHRALSGIWGLGSVPGAPVSAPSCATPPREARSPHPVPGRRHPRLLHLGTGQRDGWAAWCGDPPRRPPQPLAAACGLCGGCPRLGPAALSGHQPRPCRGAAVCFSPGFLGVGGGEAGGFAAVCGAWTERPGRQGRAS